MSEKGIYEGEGEMRNAELIERDRRSIRSNGERRDEMGIGGGGEGSVSEP